MWTRKQAGIRAHGTLALDGGPPRLVEALAVIDDTAGYHARVTEWRWSAGVGTSLLGTALAWNLVSGVNDPPTGSERAVWVDGEPHEVAPVAFSEDLSSVVAGDGSKLEFSPRGRAQPPRASAAREQRLPGSLRQLLGRASRRDRACDGPGGDGAPPRALVAPTWAGESRRCRCPAERQPPRAARHPSWPEAPPVARRALRTVHRQWRGSLAAPTHAGAAARKGTT